MTRLFFRNRFIFVQFFLLFFYTTLAFPASVDVIRLMNFGKIIASPYGDVIEIDARFGPDEELAVLTNGGSIVQGGYSGLVRVISDFSGQTINITYPSSSSLTADGFPDMIVDDMSSTSRTYAFSTMAGEVIYFDVGGRLHINSGFPGHAIYSNTITIDVDIINP